MTIRQMSSLAIVSSAVMILISAPLFLSSVGAQPQEIDPAVRGYTPTPEARLASVEYKLMQLSARQDASDRQIQTVMAMHDQVAVNTNEIRAVAARIVAHETAQLNDPRVIAELQTKMNWLLTGLGSLVLGSAAWMLKQIADNARIARSLNEYNVEFNKKHQRLMELVSPAEHAEKDKQ